MPPKWTFHESVPAAMDNRSLKALLHEYWLTAAINQLIFR